MADETPWTSPSGQFFFSKMPFNVQTLLKGRGTCVIDKIWQVWENRTIQFRKSDYPILEVLELNQ
jgi:hypothetical protein